MTAPTGLIRPNDPDVGGSIMDAALPFLPFSAMLGLANVDIGYRLLGLSPLVGAGAAIAIDNLRLTPFLITRPTFVDKLAFVTTVNGGAGSVARVGIYRASAVAPFLPTTLVVDGGSLATDAAAGGKITSISVMLPPGWYWAAYNCGVAAPTVRTLTPIGGSALGYEVVAAVTTANVQGGLSIAAAFGALPASLAANALSAYTVLTIPAAVFARVNA